MSVHYEVRGLAAVLQLDHPPVNGLNLATRTALADGMARALADPQVQVIVITGTDRVFSGGADIREFNSAAALTAPTLLDLVALVEGSAKPVVSAINGVCMGGGLELSLACHYRLATPNASLALPEVKLGLLPGAGGTQRLPRAIGAARALEMIVGGEPVDAEVALRDGLVDAVVSNATFDDVLDFARRVAAGGARPRLRDRAAALPEGAGAALFFTQARHHVAQSARGLQAPQKCIDAIEAAVLRDFDDGIRVERALFMELVTGEQSRALRHAFFAERAASKVPDLPESTPVRTIRSVGVVGFGTMGVGIAMSLAAGGLAVTAIDVDPAALARGLASCRAHWESAARKGRLAADEVERRLGLIRTGGELAQLAGADLVIEAVHEELALKQRVFRELDAVVRAGAVLASNTSTLDLDRIAAVTGRPEDVIGLHFFSPAHVMRLVEVVRAARTSNEVLATAIQLLRRLRKVAVVARVCDGFIGNRMVEQVARQAMFLIDEGASPSQVDAALCDFGMAMGPFATADLAGLDVGHAIRQRRAAERPELRTSRIADRLVDAGRLGQKNGLGWYRYEAGSRVPLPDPAVDALIDEHRRAIGIAPRAVAREEIVDRCLWALVNEGARLLDEGIAQRAGDIDVVFLAGYGFPPARGGPMYHAQATGFDRVIGRMREFAQLPHGDPAFWTPAPRLLRAAERGRWD